MKSIKIIGCLVVLFCSFNLILQANTSSRLSDGLNETSVVVLKSDPTFFSKSSGEIKVPGKSIDNIPVVVTFLNQDSYDKALKNGEVEIHIDDLKEPIIMGENRQLERVEGSILEGIQQAKLSICGLTALRAYVDDPKGFKVALEFQKVPFQGSGLESTLPNTGGPEIPVVSPLQCPTHIAPALPPGYPSWCQYWLEYYQHLWDECTGPVPPGYDELDSCPTFGLFGCGTSMCMNSSYYMLPEGDTSDPCTLHPLVCTHVIGWTCCGDNTGLWGCSCNGAPSQFPVLPGEIMVTPDCNGNGTPDPLPSPLVGRAASTKHAAATAIQS